MVGGALVGAPGSAAPQHPVPPAIWGGASCRRLKGDRTDREAGESALHFGQLWGVRAGCSAGHGGRAGRLQARACKQDRPDRHSGRVLFTGSCCRGMRQCGMASDASGKPRDLPACGAPAAGPRFPCGPLWGAPPAKATSFGTFQLSEYAARTHAPAPRRPPHQFPRRVPPPAPLSHSLRRRPWSSGASFLHTRPPARRPPPLLRPIRRWRCRAPRAGSMRCGPARAAAEQHQPGPARHATAPEGRPSSGTHPWRLLAGPVGRHARSSRATPTPPACPCPARRRRSC